MKNVLATLAICIGLFSMQAQDQGKEDYREKIKELKTAFLTQEMSLSKEGAQKFWPIYNEYEAKQRDLRKREHRDLPNLECITEGDANEMLEEYVNIEKEDYILKKQLFKDLREIMSAQEIIKLQKLEGEFHKKLIKEYRARKERERKEQKREE
ncbi:hypothetical protein SAMN05444483_101516 [Salegentibacter echinorum]|uniref:LTXXQ motif family protein n=1 Tax=Salegentibacter echinorum TaxID=1073325 RepID=A0A1M5CGV3_SALEC|nr:hypothetical protein [Salegentibacter echinorum]SHF53910.1 hypothetical protein SAMN05444483_101516 [Salegentibacter echinorum]